MKSARTALRPLSSTMACVVVTLGACSDSALSVGDNRDGGAAVRADQLDATSTHDAAPPAKRDSGPSTGTNDDDLIAEIKDRGGLRVSAVTIACTSQCVDVRAIASGGNPPYTFVWQDGQKTDARQICATADTTFEVSVQDTPYGSGEFAYLGQTTSATLSARVLGCGDAGVCRAGPALGVYQGTYAIGGMLTGGSIEFTVTKSQQGVLDVSINQALVVLPGKTDALGTFDCVSSAFSLSGTQDFGQQAWLWAGTFDASTQTFEGEAVQHFSHDAPLPKVGERPSDGSGTWSSFTATRVMP